MRIEYERRLEGFQRSLRKNCPEGLIESLSFALRGLPWADDGGSSWEDWYLVDGFKALGKLNEAAVESPNREPHDAVAKQADGGTGGLYSQLKGDLALGDARFATWVSKPSGMSYAAFLSRMAEVASGWETDLWQRQLTLGPAPEFCLHSRVRLGLPKGWSPLAVRLRRVGGEGGHK